jgi:hypothetical protein
VAPPVRRYSSCCFVAVRTTYSQKVGTFTDSRARSDSGARRQWPVVV